MQSGHSGELEWHMNTAGNFAGSAVLSTRAPRVPCPVVVLDGALKVSINQGPTLYAELGCIDLKAGQ